MADRTTVARVNVMVGRLRGIVEEYKNELEQVRSRVVGSMVEIKSAETTERAVFPTQPLPQIRVDRLISLVEDHTKALHSQFETSTEGVISEYTRHVRDMFDDVI